MTMSVIHFRDTNANAIDHLLASHQFMNYCICTSAKCTFNESEHSIYVPMTYPRYGNLFDSLPTDTPPNRSLLAHVPFIRLWLNNFPVSSGGVEVNHGTMVDPNDKADGRAALAMEWVAIRSPEEVFLIAQTFPSLTLLVGYCSIGEAGDIYKYFFNESWGRDTDDSVGDTEPTQLPQKSTGKSAVKAPRNVG